MSNIEETRIWDGRLILKSLGAKRDKPRIVVEGVITAPTRGWTITLNEAVPPVFNPTILLLNLIVDEPDGLTAQVLTDINVRLEKHLESGDDFAQIQIDTEKGDSVTIAIE